jgi:hypothetical protein
MTESNHNTDRRQHYQLRDIFDQAYRVAFPLLDSKQGLQTGGSVHFLHVVLHEEFPDLHQQDIAILSASIQRVFRDRGKSID